MSEIKIGGLQKLTLIDYPGQVAASIFLAGCNFRCGFCHNPDLVEIKAETEYIPEKDVLEYLEKRQGLLDAVCIGGGEPLLQPGLTEFFKKLKTLGYLIKLDTNGYNSKFLQELMEKKLLDYIAMDIKGSIGNYEKVTGLKSDFKSIKESVKLIMASGLPYEFRTTVLPKFHNLAEMEKIGQMIKGAANYYLQNFRNKKTLDLALAAEPSFSEADLVKMREIALKFVKKCEIRG